MSFKSVLYYLVDILFVSETFDEHICYLQEVFDQFRKAGLKFSPQKCKYAQRNCIILGHEVSKEGLKPPFDRLKHFTESCSKNKALKHFLGPMNWFKRYIPQYSVVANQLYKLLCHGEKSLWQSHHQAAFEQLKNRLINVEALAYARYDLPFYLAVDSSSKGIGYMLYQKHSSENHAEIQRVVRFGSRPCPNGNNPMDQLN